MLNTASNSGDTFVTEPANDDSSIDEDVALGLVETTGGTHTAYITVPGGGITNGLSGSVSRIAATSSLRPKRRIVT